MSEPVQEREQTLLRHYSNHVGKVSDKWSIYLFEYGRLLAAFRQCPVRLLEIGIQNGGSLEVWSTFFPSAQKIVGCDIDPLCGELEFADPNISVVIGDANSDAAEAEILIHASSFDLVIDDGSHRSGDIVKSFARYFPHLTEGGLFVVEDLHCSYWKEFEGGLFDPFSSIAFFKRLADVLNHEHWGVGKAPSAVFAGFFARYGFSIEDDVLLQVHSIEFINSICVVHKRRREHNVLGLRFIAGKVEHVREGHLPLHQTLALPCSQLHNPWSMCLLPPDEELFASQGQLRGSQPEQDSLRAGTQVQHGELMRRIVHAEARVTACDAVISGQARRVAERDLRIEQLQGAQLASDMRIAEFGRMLAEEQSLIERQLLQLSDRDQLIERIQHSVESRDERIAALGLQLQAQEAVIAQRDCSIAERDLSLARVQGIVVEREQKVAAVVGKLAVLDATLERQDREIAAHVLETMRLSAVLAAKDQSIGELDARLAGLGLRLGQLTQALAQSEGEAEGARRVQAQQARHIDVLDQNLLRHDAQQDELRKTLALRDTTVNELHRTVSDREVQLRHGRQELELARQSVQYLEQTLEAARRLTDETALSVTAQAEVITELRATLTERTATQAECAAQLAERNTQVLVLQAALDEIERRRWVNRAKQFFGRSHAP